MTATRRAETHLTPSGFAFSFFLLAEGAESSQCVPVDLRTAAAFGRNEIFIAHSSLESHSGVCVCVVIALGNVCSRT